MNEEDIMDKKNFIPLPPKAITPDVSSANRSVANKQDTTAWGPSPRGNNPRRRNEASLSRSSSAGDFSNNGRKYSPNKSKEKRVKARGNYSGESVNGKRTGPEVGSVQAPGAKKREWDNLFYFAPRDHSSRCVWKSHHAHRGRHDSGGGSMTNKFSKENFLRANCQFMVKNGKDYEPYIADPDLLVDWNDVQQIVVTMIGEGASCPICLGPPVAAKMTRCGHIYCWSCILHYLALSDQKSRPCPICYESISSKDLKSVVAHVHFDVEIGDILDLELLRRHKDMRSVSPLHSHEATEQWNELYAKVLVMSLSDVLDKVLNREEKELTAKLSEDPDCPEVCFIHQGLTELSERKKNLMSLDEGGGSDCEKRGDSENTTMALTTPQSPASDDYIYFYQDCKGLNVFLHPMNFAMLAKEFGTEMDSWPRYLSLRVIDKEYHTANEDSRKRWKCLRHLPLSTPFIIVEVDLDEFVSPDVMNEFSSQIQYRKTRRANRAKEEKKMEKIIAERERKLWKIPAVPQFEHHRDFPEFAESHGIEGLSADEFLPIGSPTSSSIDEITMPSSTSFAQIASRAPVQMKKSPSFPMSGSEWSSSVASGLRARRQSDSEPEPDDYVAVPEFRSSVKDAITKALEGIALESKTSDKKNAKKGKKNKGKVLFATGGGGMGSFN